jgi:hypothetical protein
LGLFHDIPWRMDSSTCPRPVIIRKKWNEFESTQHKTRRTLSLAPIHRRMTLYSAIIPLGLRADPPSW